MYEIDTKLEQLEEEDKPIRVALIGAGQMGKDIVAQIAGMKGMECDVVVDLTADLAREAYAQAGYTGEVVEVSTSAEAEAAIAAGKKAVSTNYRTAVGARQIQSVIDATGSPEMGARVTMECIFYKKHIVMMNVECDITVGPILHRLCRQAGVVYSLTAGDEPGSIVEVFRFAKALGFKVVAAGKGKNNPLDIYANPGMKEWQEKAAARRMNPRMLLEFVDGSKTMIEMAAVANATGLVPDCRGMHGPHCNVKDLKTVFSLKSQGGILTREGVVDYGIGDINPGVFVVVTTDQKRIIDELVQRDMGTGSNYLLYRPLSPVLHRNAAHRGAGRTVRRIHRASHGSSHGGVHHHCEERPQKRARRSTPSANTATAAASNALKPHARAACCRWGSPKAP